MSVTTTSQSELSQRVGLAFTRFVTLLSQVDPTVQLRGSEWSVRDVGAHLLNVLCRYTQKGFDDPSTFAATPLALTEMNQHELAHCEGMQLADIVDLLEAEFERYLAMHFPLEKTYPFHGGYTIDGAGAQSNLLGELLLHGYDVARAARKPWPLDERDFVLIFNGALQIAPPWLDRHAAKDVCLDVALKISGATPQLFHVSDGALAIRELSPDDRPHSVVRGPAVALLLLFYQRINLASAIGRGVFVTGGRRPWLGLQLPRLFLPI